MIDDGEVRYCLTPFGTCLEGEWDEVMAIVKRCHDQARSVSKHVLTTIRIEDEQGVNDTLIANVASVERGRPQATERSFRGISIASRGCSLCD